VSAPVFICPFAADAVVGEVVTLSGAEARHAATVQRRREGDRLDLVDGAGRRVGGPIVAVRDGELDIRVEDTSHDADPPITLVQALAKAGRDEQAVESATELGVTRIVPWAAERSIVQWKGPKAAKGRAQWVSLATAATKQSRRALIPHVEDVRSSKEVEAGIREAVARGERVLVLHEVAATPLASLTWEDPHQPVWLIVGPEGGISDAEVGRFVAAGAEVVLLGPHVLRASSAGPAAIAGLAIARGTWAARRPTLGA
jgi:16S rRNA (uracil1498-N3)-methyltransferase